MIGDDAIERIKAHIENLPKDGFRPVVILNPEPVEITVTRLIAENSLLQVCVDVLEEQLAAAAAEIEEWRGRIAA